MPRHSELAGIPGPLKTSLVPRALSMNTMRTPAVSTVFQHEVSLTAVMRRSLENCVRSPSSDFQVVWWP